MELAVPARGSTEGPWAFAEMGVTSNFATGPQRFNRFGGDLSAAVGVGLSVERIRLSPMASFSAGPRVSDVGASTPLVSVEWSSLGVSLAAPDLLNETRLTGLRLTPSLGITIPTGVSAFVGFSELTRLSAAIQLERRFGRVELAYRVEGAHLPCVIQVSCVTRWDLDNTLFLEAWLLPELSLAFGATWSMTWLALEDGMPRRSCGVGDTCQFDAAADRQPNKSARSRLLLSWAFTSLFGATLESHAAIFVGRPASLGVNIGVWFRTDPLLDRNWLDR